MKKKLLLGLFLGSSVFAFASRTYTWVSTCGVRHYTTFPDNWSNSQAESYMEAINLVECKEEANVTIQN